MGVGDALGRTEEDRGVLEELKIDTSLSENAGFITE